MAKRKKYYGINGAKSVMKNLKNVMKAVGQKYSIRIGILGEKASQKHEGSDLTNAELGAVHEFGATINVTPKMRAFLHHIGVHLKKDTTQIVIPTRSFLRRVLFDKKIQEYIYSATSLINEKDWDEIIAQDAINGGNLNFMEDIAKIIGAKALESVQISFDTGGYPGAWAPISEITKKRRKGDPDSPPLDDTGTLKDSIKNEVKKVK